MWGRDPLGRLTLLRATDPLKDFPVAFALVSRHDQEPLARFLRSWRDQGWQPRVVVSDGSRLSPSVLAAVWPAAELELAGALAGLSAEKFTKMRA